MPVDERHVTLIKGIVQGRNPKRNGKLRFSVELGRGATYSTHDITLYALDRYERSSVLAGRERRSWVCAWEGNDAESQADARETIKAAGIERITDWNIGGTSYVPISQIVSHLPDDTDY